MVIDYAITLSATERGFIMLVNPDGTSSETNASPSACKPPEAISAPVSWWST